jgi:hypothetical protein
LLAAEAVARCGENSLEHFVREKRKYAYLIDDAGQWTVRQDVRCVQYLSGRGPLRNERMTVSGGNPGPEYGIGHILGNAIDAPVMVLKCCIGNRAPGSAAHDPCAAVVLVEWPGCWPAFESLPTVTLTQSSSKANSSFNSFSILRHVVIR